MCFLNISHEAETYEFPKTWDKWILMLRENYEKTQAFQSYGLLTYFTQGGNPYNCQTMGWVNSHITEQVWENTDNSQGFLYLTDLELMKTHAILHVWECTNSHNMEVFCGKLYHSQALGFWGDLGIFFPSSWKIDGNTYIFPTHGS